jgi:hypothetical protein
VVEQGQRTQSTDNDGGKWAVLWSGWWGHQPSGHPSRASPIRLHTWLPSPLEWGKVWPNLRCKIKIFGRGIERTIRLPRQMSFSLLRFTIVFFWSPSAPKLTRVLRRHLFEGCSTLRVAAHRNDVDFFQAVEWDREISPEFLPLVD